MAHGGHACWGKYCTANLKWPWPSIPISPVYCQHQPIQALWVSVHALWSIVAQARIWHSVFCCRRRVRAVILADDRVIRYSVGERCDIIFIMFSIVFIADCFMRKCHAKRIMIPSAFVDLFCSSKWFQYLLVGQLIGCLVGCLVIFLFCCCLLFGWSVWLLVLVHSGAGWLPAWPHHDHFTP